MIGTAHFMLFGEMGWARGTCEGYSNAYRALVEKPEGK
jgi:hypothetical protein